MFWMTEEKKKEIVGLYLYEGESYDSLSEQYHIPVFVLKHWVAKYTDLVVAAMNKFKSSSVEAKDEIYQNDDEITVDSEENNKIHAKVNIHNQKDDESTAEDMTKAKESLNDGTEETTNATDSLNDELEEDIVLSPETNSKYNALTKYDKLTRIKITVAFLVGMNSINELAIQFDVSRYVIFAWIIKYYDEAVERISKRPELKVKVGNISQFPYAKKYKKVICKLYREGLQAEDICQLFGASVGSVKEWDRDYVENYGEYEDLDVIAGDYLMRKKIDKEFRECREIYNLLNVYAGDKCKELHYDRA